MPTWHHGAPSACGVAPTEPLPGPALLPGGASAVLCGVKCVTRESDNTPSPPPARDFLDVLLNAQTHTHSLRMKAPATTSVPSLSMFTHKRESRLLSGIRLRQDIGEHVTMDGGNLVTLKSSL